MRKKFCEKCYSLSICKRPCKIVNAELMSKGVYKEDEKTKRLKPKNKEITICYEHEMKETVAKKWNGIIYGASTNTDNNQ